MSQSCLLTNSAICQGKTLWTRKFVVFPGLKSVVTTSKSNCCLILEQRRGSFGKYSWRILSPMNNPIFNWVILLTRPYTRAEVACGWAGAAKKSKVLPTETDRQTDRAGHRVACTRLKILRLLVFLLFLLRDKLFIFSRVHATLQPTLSVCRSVGLLVTLSFFSSSYAILSHFKSFQVIQS